MHALVMELAAGRITKEINASDVDRLLTEITPTSPVEQIRFDLAVELLDDIRRLDQQLKDSHRRIRQAVTASPTLAVSGPGRTDGNDSLTSATGSHP